MDIEICGSLWKLSPEKGVSFMYGWAKVRLNLIKEMDFVIQSRLMQE